MWKETGNYGTHQRRILVTKIPHGVIIVEWVNIKNMGECR